MGNCEILAGEVTFKNVGRYVKIEHHTVVTKKKIPSKVWRKFPLSRVMLNSGEMATPPAASRVTGPGEMTEMVQ